MTSFDSSAWAKWKDDEEPKEPQKPKEPQTIDELIKQLSTFVTPTLRQLTSITRTLTHEDTKELIAGGRVAILSGYPAETITLTLVLTVLSLIIDGRADDPVEFIRDFVRTADIEITLTDTLQAGLEAMWRVDQHQCIPFDLITEAVKKMKHDR